MLADIPGLPSLFGPDQLLDLVAGLLRGLVLRAGGIFQVVTEYYVLWTGNFNSHGGAGTPASMPSRRPSRTRRAAASRTTACFVAFTG